MGNKVVTGGEVVGGGSQGGGGADFRTGGDFVTTACMYLQKYCDKIYAVSPFLRQTNIMWLTVGLIHDASFASSIVFGNGPITFRNDAAVNIPSLLCIISKM